MASIELLRLLAELKRVTSPVERMKLVARSWRAVRRLSPGELRELAAHVGLEGAEELLERLASRGGGRLSPSLLLRALDKVRDAEPTQVHRVLEGFRDRRRRRELIERGIAALSAEAAKPAAPAAPENEVAPAEPQPPAAQPTTEPAAPAPPAATRPAGARAAADTPELSPDGAEAPAPAPPPPVPPVAEAPVPSEPALARPPRSAPPPPPPPAARAVERAQAVAPATPPASGLVARIGRAAFLVERFRALREGLAEGPPELAPEQLRRLLDEFPAGWARRRALSALLRAGIPADLDQAVELIDDLQSSRARRWCASIVLDRWPLTDAQRAELAKRHGLSATRTSAARSVLIN